MNKYKDMSNTELLDLLLEKVKENQTALISSKINRWEVYTDNVIEVTEIYEEIYSRMIPRKSVKLTVK